jgi:hypothetical protein
VDRVERLAREVQEFLFWGIGGLREWIHPKVLLDVLHRRLEIVVDQEGARDEPVAVGARFENEVAARRVALVVGRQEQKLATLALRRADSDRGGGYLLRNIILALYSSLEPR